MNIISSSPHFNKHLKRVVCSLLCCSFLLLSCTANQQSASEEPLPINQQDALEPILEQVNYLILTDDYQAAADILRSVGQQEYSYYRMDEVLFLLGRCNLELNQPVKAQKCFQLLRKYYPRCEVKFPYLTNLEERTSESLSLLPPDQLNITDPAKEAEASAAKYGGPLVSNSFYETDLRQALMDLSTQSGITIVPDAMVHGYITMDIFDVPLEKALSLILTPLGYGFRKVEDYYIVGSPEKDNPSFPLLAETREIKPKHLPADEVPKLLPDYYNNFLKINQASNTLTISAPPDIISRFQQELAAVDLPPQQIMIEAVVVEMGQEARRSLGLDWDWTGTKANNSFQISKLIPAAVDSAFFGELLKTNEVMDNVVFDLRLALRALALKDEANIRANPRLVTQDGREAAIRIGREAYYSLIQGSTAYSYITLEKIATGIDLRITPYVGSNADITSDIILEVSDVTGSGVSDLPVTSVRSVQTRVQVANGQTIGIGGLVSENKREQRNRIPFLGDIPYLGYLFGHTVTEREETEVVVLITPHLLINPSEFDHL